MWNKWSFNYPQSEAWNNVFSGQKRHVAMGGGIRSGKTYWEILTLAYINLIFPGSRNAIIRCSSAQLSRTTEPTLLKILEEGLKYYTKNPSIPYNFSSKTVNFKNGSKLMLIAENYQNDKAGTQWLGMELNCIGFEEANELQPQSIEMACTRIGSWQGVKNYNKCPAVALYTFNPCKGYIKERFYDRKVNSTLPTNESFTISLAKHNKKNLGEKYFQILEEMPENKKRVYVDGDWDFVESTGLAFTNWNVCNTMPYGFELKQFGLDYGFVDPMAIIEYRQTENRKHFFKEICYDSGLNANKVATVLRNNGYVDEYIRCDSSAAGFISDLREHEINAIKCKAQSKELVKSIYQLRTKEIYIHEKSKNLIYELENYHLGLEEKPLSNQKDHLIDACRYGSE